MKYFTFSILVLCMLILSCSSGKKALEQGDYYGSVMKSVKRLRQAPNNRKAQETLRDAYPRLLTYNQDRIKRLKTSSDPIRWERVTDLYGELNRVYDEILRSPSASRVSRVRETSAPTRKLHRPGLQRPAMPEGERELAKGRNGDRQAAKQAYAHFEKASQLKPNFRDSRDKMNEARDLATIHVLVEPIPMHSRTLALSNEFFQNQIFEYVRGAGFSKFVQFYSAREYQGRQRDPDHVIRMVFDDFIVGQSHVREIVEDRVVDSVVVGTVEVKEEGEYVTKDVYGTVKAQVHIFEKTISSSGLLDFRILDPVSRAVLTQKKFPGTFVWKDHWGFFNGDERALTKQDRDYLRHKREVPNPPPQDLFIEFTRPIYSQVTRFTGDFYRRY